MPEISVIVPVYNTEQYIHRCIESILSQSFKDFELILINDGSTDASGTICDEYALKDSRIRVFHQQNRGQATARNFALDWIFANSDSVYISFIDSNDWVHPEYLEKLLYAIKKYDAPISQCAYKRVESENSFNVSKNLDDSLILASPEEQYSKWYNANFCGKMFSKESFDHLRFPEGKIFEDVLIWYKLLFSFEKVAIIDEILYYYYQRSDNTTNSAWTPAKLSQIEAWEKQLDFAHEHDSEDVLHAALERCCWVFKHQCDEIKASNLITKAEKKKYYAKLIRRFRKILLYNGKELKKIGILFQYSSYAYPRISLMFRGLRRICGKTKRAIKE